jgi:hypothetical protein
MKRLLVVLAGCLVLGAAGPAHAQKLTTGKTVLWVGLNGNRSHLMEPSGANPFFEAGEYGLHLAGSYFLTDAWAAVVSGGFDVGSRQVELSSGIVKTTSNSWNLRLGFDRYAFIDDKVALYAGPGLMFWRGNAEGDGYSDPLLDREWPTVGMVAFNGRLGMYARFAPHYALFGHIGQVIGVASEDSGENRVWSSHHEGSVGLAIDL